MSAVCNSTLGSGANTPGGKITVTVEEKITGRARVANFTTIAANLAWAWPSEN